jgi:amidophosphoribosyltransferase
MSTISFEVVPRTIESLEMSCFTGEYVTGTVTPEYLAWVEANQLS